MLIKDPHNFIVGMNSDDTPEELQPGEYVDSLNGRTGSSDQQHGAGLWETLRGEVGVLINPETAITYYGAAIGGNFIYSAYEEVAIGSQVWMKKNYDFAYPGSKVYNDDESNRGIYGGLYTHDEVMEGGFCPDGYRVPTVADIEELMTYLGGVLIAGGKMKESGEVHWDDPNLGASNSSGFKGLPGGKLDLLFDLLGENGLFWLRDEGLEPPVADTVIAITTTGFTANWSAVTGAVGYLIDVAIDAAFASIVSSYNDLDVGNVLALDVTGLASGKTYFYRVRAYDDYGPSENSNIISLDTAIVSTYQYVIIVLATYSIRKGIRNGYFVIDMTLTATGFGGVENTDWENIKQIQLAI